MEHLRLVVDSMSAAVARCSRDLRFLWVSRAYADWVGQTPDTLVGRSLVDVIGPEVLSVLQPYIARVLNGERLEYEQQLPLRGKGLRWIHAVYTPTFDGGEAPDGWVAVVTDVHERRQAEDALRRSEGLAQRLAAIVMSSDDAIVSKDLDGIITSWNQAAERMFGWTADETIGHSIRMIIPEDRQQEEDLVLARIRSGRVVEHFETLRRRRDGTMLAVSLTVSPIRDGAGVVIGASKSARDITERRAAEAFEERTRRQAVFVAQASAALIRSRDVRQALKTLATFAVPQIADWCAIDVVQDDGDLLRLCAVPEDAAQPEARAAARAQFDAPGVTSTPDYVARTGVPVLISTAADAALAPPGMPEPTSPIAADVTRAEHGEAFLSYICVPLVASTRTLGTLTWATLSSGRHYTEDDLRFAEDVAFRVALAIQNARAFDQLDMANRLKDEFLATLSHELRTPLNAVLGYARILRSGTLPDDRVPQALQVIERNATALTQIVEDVLDISRIISGKTRMQVRPVDLGAVISSAIETVAPAADAKGVRIEAVLDSQDGPVSGDAERLQQVVWNLVSNAVKFTPRGGRVQVRLECVNSHVEISVGDTGIGIPASFLPHIFERFRQAEAGTTRRHGGLGLGLAITRHLVEMHGGSIQALSDGEGAGATFRVRLPIMIVHADSGAGEERTHPRVEAVAPAAPSRSLSGLRVLAVDDDRDALDLLRDVLEAAGAEVTVVGSAAAALEKIAGGPPDVLIADLGMPVVDGFELIARIRQSPDPAIRNIPAAALTAYARSDDRAKALRSGFSIHLAKPIDPGELVAAVTALRRQRGHQV
jgi:PAS domain S-box-containing protein